MSGEYFLLETVETPEIMLIIYEGKKLKNNTDNEKCSIHLNWFPLTLTVSLVRSNISVHVAR